MAALQAPSSHDGCLAKKGCRSWQSNKPQCPWLCERPSSVELRVCVLPMTEQHKARGPVLYRIRVACGTRTMHVLRRYTEFRDLWQALSAAGAAPVGVCLPRPRGLCGRLNPFGASVKRRQLDGFLKALVAAGGPSLPFVRDFLGLGEMGHSWKSGDSLLESTLLSLSLLPPSDLCSVAEECELLD